MRCPMRSEERASDVITQRSTADLGVIEAPTSAEESERTNAMSESTKCGERRKLRSMSRPLRGRRLVTITYIIHFYIESNSGASILS